jgi:hypothetical protein
MKSNSKAGNAGCNCRGVATLFLQFLVAVLLAGSGCRSVHETAKLPMRSLSSVMPGGQAQQADPAALQTDLLRYADDFFARTSRGAEECARTAQSAEQRVAFLDWRLTINTAALGIATGANPTANLVDFLGLSSVLRVFLQQQHANAHDVDSVAAWLENSRALETNAWRLAQLYLTPDQQRELRTTIDRWLEQGIKANAGFFRRPLDVASGIRLSSKEAKQTGSVFGLIGLDPTAGLDPAVREVTRTRLFAERALFAAERMPVALRWQAELLAEKLLLQEGVTNALTSLDRLSRATESASHTAALLPERLSAERKAILDAFDAQEGQLRELAAQMQHTLATGEKMSTSLNTTLTTFDALMKRFGVGEPGKAPRDTNAPPFSILDYAQTAERITAMAQQLDLLLKNATGTVETPALDKRIAQLETLSRQARADAKSVLNHAFLLLAGLVLLSFACLLAVRRLSRPASSPAGRATPAWDHASSRSEQGQKSDK